MGGETLASLTDIISGIGSVSTWFWSLFTDLVGMITSNSLLLWSVVLAIVIGSLGLARKVVKAFGVKGRR